MSADDTPTPPSAGPPDGAPPPAAGDAKTVFMPLDAVPTPPPPTPPPPPADRADEDKTVPPPAASPAAPPSHEATEAPRFQTAFAARAGGQGIQVGDVLNHIFEVKRFIARGGMGEVFEGVNVNSDERVAIKVMLPALAADPNVIAMFRKEARTLTRLQHEALVNYRVLAQEPQLGVLYIVTEYVAGTNLADVLGALDVSPAELSGLLRRLASGLRAAHQLGAVHRDMSPDNVLLGDGKLEKAKIIDFGIAKELDPGTATIVGDGFAGKLNYVAPEQLGDFGREIGPWTDVYSLGLVILAVAGGRNVAMGGSLVDAVDKRRAGPDLSAAPDILRPVLGKMLAANPVERFRSMDEVLAALDATGAPALPVASEGGGPNRVPLIAGGVAGLLVLATAGWYFLGSNPPAPPAGTAGGTAATGPVAAADLASAARDAVNSVAPSVNCTWLDVIEVAKQGSGVVVRMTGVAGSPSAAQSTISRALTAAGIASADIDFGEVAQITPAGCAALNAYRTVRDPEAQRLTFAQRKFEMSSKEDNTVYSLKPHANIVFEINIDDPKSDFAITGIDPSGLITPIFESRKAFEQMLAERPELMSKLGSDRYRVTLPADHMGWSGVMLVTGKGPFDTAVIAPALTARGPDWTNSFARTAATNGWKTDMVWAKNVDETPG